MMTREDMLRELELLPVWRIRQPTKETTNNTVVSETQVSEKPLQEQTVTSCYSLELTAFILY